MSEQIIDFKVDGFLARDKVEGEGNSAEEWIR